MDNNSYESDLKRREKRRKVCRFFGIVGAVIVGICNVLMIFAGDFDIEAFLLFVFCFLLAKFSKSND